MRRVQLGPSEGATVAVRSGVTDSESLVVDGTHKVAHRARVEPNARNAAPPGAPTPGAAGAPTAPGATGAPTAPARGPRPGA
jgi:hypothetical protein